MKEHLQQAKTELGIPDWRRNTRFTVLLVGSYGTLYLLLSRLQPWVWMQSFFPGAPEGTLKFYLFMGLGVVIFVPAAIISLYKIKRDRAHSEQKHMDYL